MTLIPVEHEYRLKSPAEGEALYRALHWFGRASVAVRGHHTALPVQFERLVRAVEPRREHTVSFERGKMDIPALARLAEQPFEYLDIRTTDATFRRWPWLPRTWVHRNSGETETTDFEGEVARGLQRFEELTDSVLQRGFISGIKEETKPVLIDFLRATGPTVNITFHIGIAAARALAEFFNGGAYDWGDEICHVDFPEGRIHGFLVTPKADDEHKAKWQSRITKALEKAHLL